MAVMACHLAALVSDHVGDRCRVSVEAQHALGTAGALHPLREWIGTDDVVILNADSVILGDVGGFLTGWDGEHASLLVHHDPARADFPPCWRFSGLSCLPNRLLAGLPPPPSDLYRAVWLPQQEAGRLRLVPLTGTAIDCGTFADYVAASLLLRPRDPDVTATAGAVRIRLDAGLDIDTTLSF
jgi:NDP-sugar pyrophosphorylase family protein